MGMLEVTGLAVAGWHGGRSLRCRDIVKIVMERETVSGLTIALNKRLQCIQVDALMYSVYGFIRV